MPTFLGSTGGQLGVPNVPSTLPIVRSFSDTPFFEYPYSLTGVTKDAFGNALGNCLVMLFRTSDNSYVHSVTSDANGNYSIPASNLFAHYLVAYKVGPPDVEGGTVNALVGA